MKRWRRYSGRYAAREAAWKRANREKVTAAKTRWKARNPEKVNAQHAVSNAIRDGKLIRQPCEVCGGKSEAHHDDYSKPLDVRWLCKVHHEEHHHESPVVIPALLNDLHE